MRRPGISRLTSALLLVAALTSCASPPSDGVEPECGTPPEGFTSRADALRRVARDVDEAVIPGAGHYVQEEKAVEMAAALARFVR